VLTFFYFLFQQVMLPEAIAIVMAPTDPTRYINHLCCRHLFVHSTFIFPTFGCIIILILSELYNVRCLFASFFANNLVNKEPIIYICFIPSLCLRYFQNVNQSSRNKPLWLEFYCYMYVFSFGKPASSSKLTSVWLASLWNIIYTPC
jgi:hypothetical protein